MPSRLDSPRVPRSPASAWWNDGMRIDPQVSVPMPAAAKLAATAAPVPPLDPPGLRVGSYGLRVCPPAELTVVMPYASSCMFALPMTTAPAAFSRATWKASSGGYHSASAIAPAVVGRPATSKLSLTTTGMPCSGPRAPDAARSRSSASASSSARPLSAIIAFSAGPRSSYAAMRARYCVTIWRDVTRPSSIAACSSGMVFSRTSNGGGAVAAPSDRLSHLVARTASAAKTKIRRDPGSRTGRSRRRVMWSIPRTAAAPPRNRRAQRVTVTTRFSVLVSAPSLAMARST